MGTITIDNGHIKWILDSTDTIKPLWRGYGTDGTMKYNNADYTVPVGKKYVCLSYKFWNRDTMNPNLDIETSGGTKYNTYNPMLGNSTSISNSVIQYPMFFEVPAGQTLEIGDGVTAFSGTVIVMGVETNV